MNNKFLTGNTIHFEQDISQCNQIALLHGNHSNYFGWYWIEQLLRSFLIPSLRICLKYIIIYAGCCKVIA